MCVFSHLCFQCYHVKWLEVRQWNEYVHHGNQQMLRIVAVLKKNHVLQHIPGVYKVVSCLLNCSLKISDMESTLFTNSKISKCLSTLPGQMISAFQFLHSLFWAKYQVYIQTSYIVYFGPNIGFIFKPGFCFVQVQEV